MTTRMTREMVRRSHRAAMAERVKGAAAASSMACMHAHQIKCHDDAIRLDILFSVMAGTDKKVLLSGQACLTCSGSSIPCSLVCPSTKIFMRQMVLQALDAGCEGDSRRW